MNILIMSVKAGYGHHSTAKAIREYFISNGHKCEMLDMFDYISPHLGNSIQNGYLISTKYFPAAYGRVYGKLTENDEPYPDKSATAATVMLVATKLRRYIREFAPDYIVCTHPFPAMVVTYFREKKNFRCPSVGIITDFTVHPFWESTKLDYYVIADALLKYEMLRKGIPAEKLLPIGIPVRKQFSLKNEKGKACAELGIENKKTVLVMSGSMGFGNMKKKMLEIDSYPEDFQVLCVCGSNKKMYEILSSIEWQKTVYVYGFVDNVDVMMDAADFIITKPGGLTTSEAFAKGLPLISVNPIPGQEDRNSDFLVNCGAAIAVNDRYSVSEALNQILSCPWRMGHMEESVKHIGKPEATKSLYEFIIKNSSASKGTENSEDESEERIPASDVNSNDNL